MWKVIGVICLLVIGWMGFGAYNGFILGKDTASLCMQSLSNVNVTYEAKKDICLCVGPTILERMSDDEFIDYAFSTQSTDHFLSNVIGEKRSVEAFRDCVIHTGNENILR